VNSGPRRPAAPRAAAILIFLLIFAPGGAVAETLAVHDMVVAADPLAAAAGRDILRAGGSAIDAAIAMAVALTVVEPESAGIGGGGFLVHWSAQRRAVTTFDGRETAPAAALPTRFLDAEGRPLAFYDAVVGGRSVGVPGLLRMLALAHQRFGKLPWARLLAPSIRLAADGFAISPRLHALLAEDRFLARNPAARRFFYGADGSAKPAGERLTNPALAATLRAIAERGADAFYGGAIAQDIVAAVATADPPGDLAVGDLASYRAEERPPVCGRYHEHRLCGIGPPSSGAVTLIELLRLTEPFDLRRHRADAEAWHVFAEASRLAYADRARWLADPDFVRVPVTGLLDDGYLAARARLIDSAHAHQGPAEAGDPPGRHARDWGDDRAPELPSTSSLAVIDRDGNAVALTASIENVFGARIMVRGFLLNNELTDFSFVPEDHGRPVANRIEAGKRPLSAMAPTLVFDAKGALELALGSAGGSLIITDVAKTILAIIDWQDGIGAAFALPNIGNRNGATDLEAGPDSAALAAALAARGHDIRLNHRPSGLAGILVTRQGLEGAADARREGSVLGD